MGKPRKLDLTTVFGQTYFKDQADKHNKPCEHPKMWRTKFGQVHGCRLCGRELR